MELVRGIEPRTCALRIRTNPKMEVIDRKATAVRVNISINREQSSVIRFVSLRTLAPQQY